MLLAVVLLGFAPPTHTIRYEIGGKLLFDGPIPVAAPDGEMPLFRVGPLEGVAALVHATEDGRTPSPGVGLLVGLFSTSETDRLVYRRPAARMGDDFKNRYPVRLGSGYDGVGLAPARVDDGRHLIDVLRFEPPVGLARRLTVTVPRCGLDDERFPDLVFAFTAADAEKLTPATFEPKLVRKLLPEVGKLAAEAVKAKKK